MMSKKKVLPEIVTQIDGQSYIRLSAFYEAEIKPAIMAPFHGVMLPVIVRRLNYAQIRSCGDFSLIETVKDLMDKKRKPTVEQMLAYSEMQYEVLKKSLVRPTYEEIMSLNEFDILRINAEKEIVEIEEIINGLPAGPKRDKLRLSLNTAKMNSRFLLPADFVAFVVSFALSVDNSDIKLVTEDMLFEAGIKAVKGHDNPSDHLPGNFTDFNKVDIDNRAWIIYHRRMGDNGRTGRRR